MIPALHGITLLSCFCITVALNITAGYFLMRRGQVAISWLLAILSCFLIERASISTAALIRMFVIIVTLFMGMKNICSAGEQKRRAFPLSFFQWMCFTLGWAGMRASIFSTLGQKQVEGYKGMLFFGLSRIVIGALILFAARKIHDLHLAPILDFILVSVFLLFGFSFILHFGLLSFSAGLWRFFGVRTYYLFNTPFKSRSLSEFWSKRWNLAFSEMTTLAVFRPVKRRLGERSAFFVAFIFSGFLHELAISFPVMEGFGWPMFYFMIQAAVMTMEEEMIRYNITFFREGILAKFWLIVWIMLPAVLLFHFYFLQGVVWPLAGMHPW